MNHATDLLLIGGIMLLALGAHTLGQRVHVPRVTLLLLVGALAGPSLLDIIPVRVSDNFPLVTELTLAMVGFLLGERMSVRDLKDGREASLLLAAIATATDPAATLDVMREAGSRGPLTRVVAQVVAIDDAWGAILFSILLVFAELVSGNGSAVIESIGFGVYEVLGAMILGVLLGLPMAWMTGRLKPGEPMLLESAGFVFLAAGIAGALELSYLLTCMALGVTVANRAHHHVRPFRSIEGIIEPFLATFFFLAGFSLEWDLLPTLGLLGGAYVTARIAGRILGGAMGGQLAHSNHAVKLRNGACLLPQAGVAMGLALVATDRLPEVAFILPLIIGSTVFFELIGPPITMYNLKRAGETGRGYEEPADDD